MRESSLILRSLMLYKDPEIILPTTFSLLQTLCSDNALNDFFLVGGTSLALQIGHRHSIDLDFFSMSSFDTNTLATHLYQNHKFEVNSFKRTLFLVI